MTFEEWLDGPSGFGNFTRKELLVDNMPSKTRDFIDDLKMAYKAGYEAGYEFGWEENDILSQTTAAANRGRE